MKEILIGAGLGFRLGVGLWDMLKVGVLLLKVEDERIKLKGSGAEQRGCRGG
jgi:hypothetical protein